VSKVRVYAVITLLVGGLAAGFWHFVGRIDDASDERCGSPSCQDHGDATPQPVRVFAGLPPLAHVVEKVGGPHVHVDVMLQGGQDPHTFEPTPRQVMDLSRASLFFKIGMPFEDRLAERMTDTQPRLTVIDATEGVKKRPAEAECCEEADHDHSAEQFDPHVWLSPPVLKTLAANVAAALSHADPGNADSYGKNLAEFDASLSALHSRIARRLAPYRGRSFFVFHPAFGYFADAYGLKQESVEMEGKSPTPRQLRELIQKARASRARVIFLQPQFDHRSAEAVAQAIDATILPMDSLAPDVEKNLDDVSKELASAMASAQ
jgi:zinc transport system substrate-binding protein